MEKHTETPESLLNGIIAYLRSPEFAAVTKEYYDENNIKVTPDLKEITFQEWNGYRLELNRYKIRVGDLWLGRSDRSDIEKLKVDITNLEIKIKEFIAKLRGINQ